MRTNWTSEKLDSQNWRLDSAVTSSEPSVALLDAATK
jgi:hypothetical protein